MNINITVRPDGARIYWANPTDDTAIMYYPMGTIAQYGVHHVANPVTEYSTEDCEFLNKRTCSCWDRPVDVLNSEEEIFAMMREKAEAIIIHEECAGR